MMEGSAQRKTGDSAPGCPGSSKLGPQGAGDRGSRLYKKLQKLMTTHIQTETEAEEWAKAAKPMADEWLKATRAEGKRLVDLMMEVRREYKAQMKK